ncbi:MAG TPA: hypothetical protein VN133_04950 [Humibacter sp.]|nr:hypothetical protein [Humibacter sp.]
MSLQTPQPVSRVQRILAYMTAALVGLSLLAIAALIAGYALGAARAQAHGDGVWPTVMFVPMIGLPVAFVLILALLIISLVGRGKSNAGR